MDSNLRAENRMLKEQLEIIVNENEKLKETINKVREYIKLNIRDIDYDTEEYDYLMSLLGDKENETN